MIRAGHAILAVNRTTMKVDGKTDGSPVTEADLAADRIIGAGLARLAPDIPSLSEERVQLAQLPYRDSFFLIDPLDGTKEFVAGRDEFTVNLALVTDGLPLLGIVSAPALGLIWRGIVGRGAERLTLGEGAGRAIEPIRTRPCPPRGQPWTVAVSRSHGDARTEAFIAGTTGRGPLRTWLGGQIRPGGGRRGRYLSPPVADLRMGRGGRPCGRHRRRRQDHGFKRRRAAFRRADERISSFRNSSPGAIQQAVEPSCSVYCDSPCSSAGQRGVASFRKRAGIGGEGIAVLLAAEQIKPLSPCIAQKRGLPA